MSEATVAMRALQWHTVHGVAHHVGDVYEAPADLVETLIVQRKAERTTVAKTPAPAPAAKAAPPPPPAVKKP